MWPDIHWDLSNLNNSCSLAFSLNCAHLAVMTKLEAFSRRQHEPSSWSLCETFICFYQHSQRCGHAQGETGRLMDSIGSPTITGNNHPFGVL